MTTNYEDLGYVEITFTNASKDADWVAWRVYRRLTAGPGNWELVEETRVNQSNYSIKDYLPKSNVQYQYAVVQVALRSGGEVESNYTASSSVTPSSTHYWLIVPSDPSYNYRIWHVIEDAFHDDVQAEIIELIGRGRKVDTATSLGYQGSLRFEIRGQGGLSPRTQRLAIEDLHRSLLEVYLRTPFGDVFRVSSPSINIERIAGVGPFEYVDCALDYTEVR
jgi:hypothetical protein